MVLMLCLQSLQESEMTDQDLASGLPGGTPVLPRCKGVKEEPTYEGLMQAYVTLGLLRGDTVVYYISKVPQSRCYRPV